MLFLLEMKSSQITLSHRKESHEKLPCPPLPPKFPAGCRVSRCGIFFYIYLQSCSCSVCTDVCSNDFFFLPTSALGCLNTRTLVDDAGGEYRLGNFVRGHPHHLKEVFPWPRYISLLLSVCALLNFQMPISIFIDTFHTVMY